MDAAAVKALARQLGWDKVGMTTPDGFHLPVWTRTVVVLGMATLDEAWDYQLHVAYQGKRVWSKWAYERLTALADRLALQLVQAGLQAEPLTYEDSYALIDLKVAAVRAGLGVRGQNNLVVSREFGPRLRFGAVFTAAPLALDAALRDYYCTNCTICWGACPDRALGPTGLDRSRCRAEFDPTPEMARRQEREARRLSPAARLQCIRCITSCPIGKKAGRPAVPGAANEVEI